MFSTLVTALSSCNAAVAQDLVSFIKANPTAYTVDDLALAFLDVAQSYPMNVDKIADAILAVCDTEDAPAIASTDAYGKPADDKLNELLRRCVFDMLTSAFEECDDPFIHPKNTLLISAMISGACARNGLCHSSAQAGMITCGLHFSRSDHELYFTPELYEVNALHSCLQLLVGGSRLYNIGQMTYHQDELLPALVSIAEKDVVKDPNGKKLLQLTIEQAKIAFTKDLPVPEIWRVLFPAHVT